MMRLVVLLTSVLLASSAIAQGAPAPPTDVQVSSETTPLATAAELSVLSYGAKCDGVTDDSVALQAAIVAADMRPYRTLRLPHGVCVFRTPLLVGGHTDRYCMVHLAGQGEYASTLQYQGPMDRAAILISHCSAFRWSGFGLSSQQYANFSTHGTSIGIHLDGPFPAGTLNTGITFDHVGIAGFATGMLAGGQASASEIDCRQCVFSYNDVGWTASNYNSLNFWFYGLGIAHNTIGVKLGGPHVTQGVHVVGGHSAGNTQADFFLGNSFDPLAIQGFRAEITPPAKFLTGTSWAHLVDLRANSIAGSETAVVMDLNGPASLTSNVIRGQVAVKPRGPMAVSLRGNFVSPGTLGQPVLWPTTSLSRMATYIDFIGNRPLNVTLGGILAYPDQTGVYTNALMPAVPSPRYRVAFPGTDSIAVTFQRTVPVTTKAGSYVVTHAADAFADTASGTPIRLLNVATYCGFNPTQPAIDSVDGRVLRRVDATRTEIVAQPWGYWSNRCEQDVSVTGAQTALVGMPEPDVQYAVTLGCQANEQFWVTDKTVQGFTVRSSNPTSTATCDVMVMR